MRAVRSIIFILVCIGLIWILLLLIGKAISGGNNTNVSTATDLAHYTTTNAQTSLYVDGPVVADQEHYAARITVDRSQTRLEIIQGYDNTVIRQQSFASNDESFRVFLKSLETAGFTRGNTTTDLRDSRGKCPLGTRYVYDLTTSGSNPIHFWSTSCSAGTYKGDRATTQQLFYNQIPATARRELVRGLPFSLGG